MRLRASVRTWLVLVASACAYHLVAVEAIQSLWLPTRDWWSPHRAESLAELAWLQLVHGACLLAGSLPVALALQPLRRALPFAGELALLGLAVPALWAGVPGWIPCSATERVAMVLAWVQFAGTLPLLTWLLARIGKMSGSADALDILIHHGTVPAPPAPDRKARQA